MGGGRKRREERKGKREGEEKKKGEEERFLFQDSDHQTVEYVGSMCHTIERTDRQGYPNC
jgi:hypothetical protein